MVALTLVGGEVEKIWGSEEPRFTGPIGRARATPQITSIVDQDPCSHFGLERDEVKILRIEKMHYLFRLSSYIEHHFSSHEVEQVHLEHNSYQSV
jgi:hypothetical protein